MGNYGHGHSQINKRSRSGHVGICLFDKYRATGTVGIGFFANRRAIAGTGITVGNTKAVVAFLATETGIESSVLRCLILLISDARAGLFSGFGRAGPEFFGPRAGRAFDKNYFGRANGP